MQEFPNSPEYFRITIIDTNETYMCLTTTHILKGMQALGKRCIPSGCHGGGCGICKIEVVEGDFIALPMSRNRVSEEDEKNGQALACRIFPRSNLTLKAIGKFRQKVYAFNTKK